MGLTSGKQYIVFLVLLGIMQCLAESNNSTVCKEDDYECAPWADCLSDWYPCSRSIIANLLLMLFFGFILARGSKLIADGSEELMEVMDPGIIGGFVLPVLGALPDATIIIFSCIGGNAADIQTQVSVGVGTLAGSTIMLLTIPWVGGLILGRCDIENGHAKDKTLTRKCDLTRTGVEADNDVRKQAVIMMITAVSYLIIQGIAFRYLGQPANVEQEHEKWYALAAFLCAAVFFVAFSLYMVLNTKLQQKRIDEIRQMRLMQRVVDNLVMMMKTKDSSRKAEEAPLVDSATEAATNTKPVDIRRIGLQWKMKAQQPKEEPEEEKDEEEEEVEEGPKRPKWKIGLTSLVTMLVVFSDPMVSTITNFSNIIHLGPFYVSFIITPITSNASELIASLIFASKKKKKNISLTFGALYGAATMNNTMCLGIFLALVFFKGIVWEFSAEVLSILFVTVVVGTIGAARNVIPLWMGIIVAALYPLSIGLVALLESPAIGWK